MDNSSLAVVEIGIIISTWHMVGKPGYILLKISKCPGARRAVHAANVCHVNTRTHVKSDSRFAPVTPSAVNVINVEPSRTHPPCTMARYSYGNFCYATVPITHRSLWSGTRNKWVNNWRSLFFTSSSHNRFTEERMNTAQARWPVAKSQLWVYCSSDKYRPL